MSARTDAPRPRSIPPRGKILPALPKSKAFPLRAFRQVVRLGQGLYFHDALDTAASMAFNFFLSLIPLLILLGFVLGNFVRRRGVDAFMGPVLEAVPQTSVDLVRHELERMAGASAASIAPLSIAGFFWMTSSGTHHMMDVFEAAVLARRRSWWKQRAIALLSVIGGLVLASSTVWLLLEGDAQLHEDVTSAAQPGQHPADEVTPAAPPSADPRANGTTAPAATTATPSSPPSLSPRSATSSHAPRDREVKVVQRDFKKRLLARVHDPWENVLALTMMAAAGLIWLACFYRFAVEHPPGIRRRAWPGAIAAVVAWGVVSWAFGTYVISLGKYAFFYGSLAAVAVLLIWLYLTSLSLLLGAEVNAQLEGVRD